MKLKLLQLIWGQLQVICGGEIGGFHLMIKCCKQLYESMAIQKFSI